MAADHFCLKWNNYLSNMASELDMLRTEENLVDVTLCCEGYKFRAHKVILSACSPYFRNVFKENPCEHPVVILKDVLPEDVEALLSYVYQGIVYVSEVKLTSFLQTAELLQIKGLADAASSFIDGPTGANANADSNSVKRRKGAPCRIVKQEDGSAENTTNNQMEAENENANDFKDDFTDNNDDDGDDGEELESENSGDVTGVAYNNYQFKDDYSNPMTPGARNDSLSNLIHQTLRQQQQGNQFTPVQHQRSSSLGPTGVESQGQG
ncbi:BTB/POZ domain [Nesidiocoris tenuis]|uniref:BTB/POZ domain n=1 Tax=Nesidiocoris tenuis TaxID=355587 RepID=A0ABN7B5J1_9HEMI|nr:BTB/POZ domain [Nesidiocoris tenuis]